jgi:hypothetical protein
VANLSLNGDFPRHRECIFQRTIPRVLGDIVKRARFSEESRTAALDLCLFCTKHMARLLRERLFLTCDALTSVINSSSHFQDMHRSGDRDVASRYPAAIPRWDATQAAADPRATLLSGWQSGVLPLASAAYMRPLSQMLVYQMCLHNVLDALLEIAMSPTWSAAYYMLRLLYVLADIVSSDFCGILTSQILQALMVGMSAMPDEHIRAEERSRVETIRVYFRELIESALPKLPSDAFEVFWLDLCLRLLESQFMDKRVLGISEIKVSLLCASILLLVCSSLFTHSLLCPFPSLSLLYLNAHARSCRISSANAAIWIRPEPLAPSIPSASCRTALWNG